MNWRDHKLGLTVMVAVAAAGLYLGWKLFWFLTDDAFIAFRYVSNSVLGHGYTWNPAPFQPVEGYTSFLWVVLLEGVWRAFGILPPVSANYLSLGFSFLTLLLTLYVLGRMKLRDALERYRLLFMFLILVGILSNRTFLAWTSSGLETALFNFCITLWIVVTVFGRKRGALWMAGLTGSASLVYLARPDGLLVLAATVLLATVALVKRYRLGNLRFVHLAAVAPLLVPVLHLGWRRLFYGEWLPNTYYAKHVAAWPEAGVRYFASFILEYALWIWMLLLLILAVRRIWKRPKASVARSRHGIGVASQHAADERTKVGQTTALSIVVATILVHLGYYTLVIGGDHFEYRVYSYLVPILFLSFVWMLNRLELAPFKVGLAIVLLIILSWPLPWTHWALTRDRTSVRETRKMFQPVSGEFPAAVWWYTETFDKLQAWLIDHSVCARHQAHKAFCQRQLNRYPDRTLERPVPYPVYVVTAVGVPGWVLPDVVIVDAMGLNDYVVARSSVPPNRKRTMAHEREAPPGYLESFAISYAWLESERYGHLELELELTAEEIIDNEAYWIGTIVDGEEMEVPALTLMRRGEFEARKGRYDVAIGLLHQAITRKPDCWSAYSLLATCYTELGQVDSALQTIEKITDFDACSPQTLTRLGSKYIYAAYDDFAAGRPRAADKFQKGEDLLQLALRRDGVRSAALIMLASSKVFRNRADSSAIYLARLENIDDQPPEPLCVLAERYAFKGEIDLAARALRLAVQCGLENSAVQRLVRQYPQLGGEAGRSVSIPDTD